MADVWFMVVEMPALEEAGSGFTARHPEAVLDIVIWTSRREEGPVYNITCMARGVPPAMRPELLDELKEGYGEIKTHRDEPDLWLGSYKAPARMLQDPAARAVADFTQRHHIGPFWVRAEKGSAFARCQLPPDVDPHAMAERFRGFAEARGVDVDVGVESTEPTRMGPWEDLMRELSAPARDAARDPA